MKWFSVLNEKQQRGLIATYCGGINSSLSPLMHIIGNFSVANVDSVGHGDAIKRCKKAHKQGENAW
jgi:hypothetical protein